MNNIKISQVIVDKIIARAKTSDCGLSDGLNYKKNHLQINQYAKQDLESLALLLVNGYDEKYDLVSVFRAALEIISELTPLLYD